MPEFELQFPLAEVADYAARTSFEDDPTLIAIGRAAGRRDEIRVDLKRCLKLLYGFTVCTFEFVSHTEDGV